MSHTARLKPWFFWGIAVSFFAFQFTLRVVPGLIMNQIMQKFSVDASQYGLLSSLYYLGYAGFQVPIAILLDQFGPKRILFICVLMCSAGSYLFGHSDSWSVLLAARFLVGVGSAAGFLGTSKIISQWFPRAQYGKMVGLAFSFGLLGAVYGGKPVALLVHHLGWSRVLDALLLVGFLLSLLVWLFIPHRGRFQDENSLPTLTGLVSLIKTPGLILLALSNFFMAGPLEGFADVWGIMFFSNAFHLEKPAAAFVVSMIFVGMLFGGPLLAQLAEYFKSSVRVATFCGIASAAILAGLFFSAQVYMPALFYILMFMTGITCCYQVLVFAAGSQMVGAQQVGLAIAILNCMNMLGGSFFHGAIGFLLDYSWNGNLENGIRDYTSHDYVFALSVIPVGSLFGAFGLLYVQRVLSKGISLTRNPLIES